MRVGVSDKCVNAVPGGLGLRLDLQRVVRGSAEIAKFQNGVAKGRGKGGYVWLATRGTTDSIGSTHATRGAVGIDGIAGHQDMVAPGTSIADGEKDLTRHLALHVDVVLHDLSKPPVPRLVEVRSTECGYGRGSIKNGKSARNAGNGGPSPSTRGGITGWRNGWASEKLVGIALGEKGRVLPEALSALAPGGIVIDGEAATKHGLVAAKNFIGGPDARFESLQIHFYARGTADTILIGNQQLAGRRIGARRGARRNKVSQTTSGLRGWGSQIPRQADIEGEILGYAPIVLDVGADDFPAAAGDRTVKGLVVFGDVHVTESEVGQRIT